MAPVQTGSAIDGNRPWRVAGIAGGALACGLVVWVFVRRPRPTPAAAHAGAAAKSASAVSAAHTVLVAPQSVTASASVVRIEPLEAVSARPASRRAALAQYEGARTEELLRAGLVLQLSRWLKQKLVRKLIEDRKDLIESQQAATLRVLAVDQRLDRLESQIQEQNLAYQRRIEELSRELLVAREENRELIRAQIVKVKAEMEAARKRAESWQS
jgi:hypothetical protein